MKTDHRALVQVASPARGAIWPKSIHKLSNTVLWCMALLLVALTVTLVVIERESQLRIDEALETEREHVGRARSARAAAHQVYVTMLERWIRPDNERAERALAVSAKLQLLREANDALATLRPLNFGEATALSELAVALASFANRAKGVDQRRRPRAIVDMHAYSTTIEDATRQVLFVESEAGQKSDRRLVSLRRRSTIAVVSLVGLGAIAVILAFVWGRQKRLVEKLYDAAELARREQERATQTRAHFFANMSHELRTPVIVIQNLAVEIATRGNPPNFAPRLRQAADELLRDINNILDVAKLEAGATSLRLETLDLSQIIQRSIRRCEGLVGTKNVTITSDVNLPLPPLLGDVVKLHQVLTNLIANAIRFTNEGSVMVCALAKPECVRIEVTDTGIGITPAAMAKIWQRFEQADDNIGKQFGGTGLRVVFGQGAGGVTSRSRWCGITCWPRYLFLVRASNPHDLGPRHANNTCTIVESARAGVVWLRQTKDEPQAQAPVARVVIAGSTALLPLVTDGANQFMSRRRNVAVEVEAGGSLTGIARVLDGSAAIGMSDVAAPPADAPRLQDSIIATVGIAAMAHQGTYNQNLRSLTLTQLRNIFNGTLRDWSELGGKSQPIVVINRKPSSGTRAAFRDLVMAGDEFVAGEQQDSSSLVVTLLEQTPGAISYVAISYLRENVKTFAVNQISASVENVATGRYPLVIHEHLFTQKPPRPEAKAFIDYMQSEEVQHTLVSKNGFVPVWGAVTTNSAATIEAR